MLRPLIGIAAFFALFSGTALAQLPFLPTGKRPPVQENALQQAEGERLHRAALKTIPYRKQSNDPWHNIRTAPVNPTLDRHRPE